MVKYAAAIIFVVFVAVVSVRSLEGVAYKWEVVARQNANPAHVREPREKNEKYQPPPGSVVLRADRSGHHLTRARINGIYMDVMVDTGATFVSLPYEEARRLGIALPKSAFKYPFRTANGVTYSAMVQLNSVQVGSIVVRNVRASVSQPGEMFVVLLGMSFLNRLNSFRISNGQLIMQQ